MAWPINVSRRDRIQPCMGSRTCSYAGIQAHWLPMASAKRIAGLSLGSTSRTNVVLEQLAEVAKSQLAELPVSQPGKLRKEDASSAGRFGETKKM